MMAVCDICGGILVGVVDGEYYVVHDAGCPHYKGKRPAKTMPKKMNRPMPMIDVMTLVVRGELTTLNKYIEAERSHRNKAAKIKKAETRHVYKVVAGSPAIEHYPLDITFTWYCRDRRSDPDNISFAQKYILDGLQLANIIRGDGWKEIASIHHEFRIDKDNQRVEIKLQGNYDHD